jgi:hypothetical protein
MQNNMEDMRDDLLIAELDKWVRGNFLFTKGLPYYNTYEDVKTVWDLPDGLRYDGFKREKAAYKNPLNLLITVVFNCGKHFYRSETKEKLNILIGDLTGATEDKE